MQHLRSSNLAWQACLLVTFGLSFGGCGHGSYVEGSAYVASLPPTAPRDGLEFIKPGDTISVRVFGEEPMSVSEARVRNDGTLALPLLGKRTVAGKAPEVLAQELQGLLAQYVTAPHVTVSIDKSPVVVTVVGEVATVGRVELEAPVRLVDVLAAAGGLSDFADESGIFVLRAGKRIRFEYRDLLRGEPFARDFTVLNGDVVVVE